MSRFNGADYQARFDALAAEGVEVHGEADFVERIGGRRVLDGGCGTGRVAIELARRGLAVLGVDCDASMLAEARRRAPGLAWIRADLAELDLREVFDVVVLAGNVPLFCPPPRRDALVASCAAHLSATGVLVAGFQLDRDYALPDWDRACAAAGLELCERYSTWDRAPFREGDAYAVSVHRRSTLA